MPTTFDEAIEYLSRYGGVTSDIEALKREWPFATCGQLRAAADHAVNICHRPKAEVDQALILLIWK